MYLKSRASWKLNIDYLLVDLLCLHLAYVLVYYMRFPGAICPYLHHDYLVFICIASLIQVVATLLLNNLENVTARRWTQEAIAVATLTVADFICVLLCVYTLHIADIYSRILLFGTFMAFALLDFFARLLWKKIAPNGILHVQTRTLLLYVDSDRAEKLIKKIRADKQLPYIIKGVILTDDQKGVTQILDVPVVADAKSAADYICREWVDEVMISSVGHDKTTNRFLESCENMGITTHMVMKLRMADRNKQFVENIAGHTVITTAYNNIALYQAVIKRIADIIGGLLGSVFALLIMIILGPVIYIKSPGPILFSQVRIGKNGKRFKIYKLRSMYPDAEERKAEFMDQNRNKDGMMFKLDFDPRVIGNRILPDGTKKEGIGEFIRKTSLDEFPQFFNVLKGDMSLVGTRPPTEDEWVKYEYHHRARLAMKPGITGLWQVSGRSTITDFEEVVKLDTRYIAQFHLALDLKILFKTVGVLLKKKGAM